jgi:hypothetical protein
MQDRGANPLTSTTSIFKYVSDGGESGSTGSK